MKASVSDHTITHTTQISRIIQMLQGHFTVKYVKYVDTPEQTWK